MTGFPDDHLDGPDGGRTDPLGPLLGPSPGYLPAPPGAFERIRRRAAWRRRLRAGAGGTAAVAVVAGALFVAGVLTPGNGDDVVGPPASSSGTSTAPAPTGRPTARPSASPSTVPTGSGAGAAAGGQGAAAVTPTAGGSGAPTSPDPGGTPMCAASHLSAALGGGDAGAGNLYRYLVLTNTGATACHVTGYPGLSMLDANGRQIGQPATRRAMTYSPVVLQPGGTASITLHTANQEGTCLPTSAKLKMYPPGSRASLKFTGAFTDCNDLFEITPFTGGSTGNPPG